MTTASGIDGRLYWSYHRAADVRGWRIDGDAHGFSLTAEVRNADTFRLSQRPLVFVALLPKGQWRFPVLELQMTGATLNARLGPKEHQ